MLTIDICEYIVKMFFHGSNEHIDLSNNKSTYFWLFFLRTRRPREGEAGNATSSVDIYGWLASCKVASPRYRMSKATQIS